METSSLNFYTFIRLNQEKLSKMQLYKRSGRNRTCELRTSHSDFAGKYYQSTMLAFYNVTIAWASSRLPIHGIEVLSSKIFHKNDLKLAS